MNHLIERRNFVTTCLMYYMSRNCSFDAEQEVSFFHWDEFSSSYQQSVIDHFFGRCNLCNEYGELFTTALAMVSGVERLVPQEFTDHWLPIAMIGLGKEALERGVLPAAGTGTLLLLNLEEDIHRMPLYAVHAHDAVPRRAPRLLYPSLANMPVQAS